MVYLADSQDIAKVTVHLGFPAGCLQDNSLADDYTGLIPALRCVVYDFQRSGVKVERFFCIMLSTLLLKSFDIVDGFNSFD